MPWVPPEEVEIAKRLDLLTYLQITEPQNLKREGAHDYRHRIFKTLTISDNGIWNWTDHKGGGTTAVQYRMKVLGESLPEAVMEVNRVNPYLNASYVPSVSTPRKGEQPEQERKLFLPENRGKFWQACDYLQKRGIHKEIIFFCKGNGSLYQGIHHGRQCCIFLGFDGKGKVRSGSARSCVDDFRRDLPGSNKRYTFSIPACSNNATILKLMEAPVDVLSAATLNRMKYGARWRDVHYLAMGGLNPIAMEGYLEKHPEIQEIHVCVDNDEAGNSFRQRFFHDMENSELKIVDCPPRYGKDYNDTLLTILEHFRRQREKEMER